MNISVVTLDHFLKNNYYKLKILNGQTNYNMETEVFLYMYKAFSLIELMVVIAIVAVLSAVSVPAYKDYIEKARLSKSMYFINAQVDKASVYYHTNSEFASFRQIGLPTIVGNDFATENDYSVRVDPSVFVGALTMNVSYPPATCPYMNLLSNVSTGDIAGLDNNEISNLTFGEMEDLNVKLMNSISYVIDLDGVLVKRCYYQYTPILSSGFGTPISGDYISNCTNLADFPDATSELTTLVNSCN